MNQCKCEEVIISTQKHRGSSVPGENSPSRIITEIFHKDGSLIAERDPLGDFTQEDMISFAKFVMKHDKFSFDLLKKWKEEHN